MTALELAVDPSVAVTKKAVAGAVEKQFQTFQGKTKKMFGYCLTNQPQVQRLWLLSA